MFKCLHRRREVCGKRMDPSVLAAAQVEATMDELRLRLTAGAPQRAEQRLVAREARDRAAQLVERNHFGESIELAMRRRS